MHPLHPYLIEMILDYQRKYNEEIELTPEIFELIKAKNKELLEMDSEYIKYKGELRNGQFTD